MIWERLFVVRTVAESLTKEQDVPKKVSMKMADSQRKKNEEQASRRNVSKEAGEKIFFKRNLVEETKEEISAKSPKLDVFDSLEPSASVRNILITSCTKPMEVDDSPSDATDLLVEVTVWPLKSFPFLIVSFKERKVARLDEEVLSQLDKEETFNHATNLLSDSSVEVKLG